MSDAPAPASARNSAIAYRPFDPAVDYRAAAALITECHRHDDVDWLPTEANLGHEWSHSPTFRPKHDAIVAAEGDRFVGLATASWRQRGAKVVHHMEVWVRPESRRRGIGATLVAWAEDHEAQRVQTGDGGPTDLPHEIGGWGDSEVPGHTELAARRGYRVMRYGMEMRRPVAAPIAAAPLPAGLEVRPVRPEDHRVIWEADTEAFRDHFEAAERGEADFEWWFSRPELDTSLWQVAWDGGAVAGSILTTVYPEENEQLGIKRAWLDHISVRRGWRRRGLAASLIASTLELLRQRGLEEAALGVDAENPTGAVRLYERMGFARAKTGISYRKDLPLDPG